MKSLNEKMLIEQPTTEHLKELGYSSTNQFVTKLQGDMEVVVNSVESLVFSRHVYQSVAGIARANSKINISNSFYDIFKLNYMSATTSSVCRQVDTDKRVISLARVLTDILDCPNAITKKWFVGSYTYGNGGGDFEAMFGDCDYVDPVVVAGDLGLLRHETKELKKFRNKRIAHFDRDSKEHEFYVDFVYLNNAVSLLEKLTVKYDLLLNQVGWADDTLLPANPDDWQEIFEVPWVVGHNENIVKLLNS